MRSIDNDVELHDIGINFTKLIVYTACSILLNKILLDKYKKTLKLEPGIVFIYPIGHIGFECRYIFFQGNICEIKDN